MEKTVPLRFPFTAEEAWLARFPSDDDSVHLRQFQTPPEPWRDEKLAAKWARLRAIRRVVTGALEVERRDKRIGASLQAHPTVYLTPEDAAHLDTIDLAELAITSSITVTVGVPPDGAFSLPDEPEIGVVAALAVGGKCQRCWRVLPEVPEEDGVCRRCASVVGATVPA